MRFATLIVVIALIVAAVVHGVHRIEQSFQASIDLRVARVEGQ